MSDVIPKFWPASIQAIDPIVIYSGPFPRQSRDYYSLGTTSATHAYVYVLLDDGGEPIYIGRARRPGNRFDKHRRRDWWANVAGLVLLQVRGDDRTETHALVSYLEMYLIHTHRPVNNVAGVPA